MTKTRILQGREVSDADIELIRSLMAAHPTWGRTPLSVELCRRWNWCNAQGRLKDMAARTLLLKLERAGHIQLPPRQRPSPNASRNRRIPVAPAPSEPIHATLRDLRPLQVNIVAPGSDDGRMFDDLLAHEHYLGHRTTVGENLRYLVRDRQGRTVACVLFGSAAWKCADRDAFIGWDRAAREHNLQHITNNTRFLIPSWVQVPHLASHVLGLITRRIHSDWQAKYGHPVYALETFVDRSRFKGTCYRAANWIRLGATQGRTRNDRAHRIKAPIKDVYLYPLIADFRVRLGVEPSTENPLTPACEARERARSAGI